MLEILGLKIKYVLFYQGCVLVITSIKEVIHDDKKYDSFCKNMLTRKFSSPQLFAEIRTFVFTKQI